MKSFATLLSDKRSALADKFEKNERRVALSRRNSAPSSSSSVTGADSGRVMDAGGNDRVNERIVDKRTSIHQRLQEAAEQRVELDLVRHRRELTQRKDARVLSDGQRLVNFSSNDYLGLAHHPAMVSAMQVAAQNCGVGAGASHRVCGHHAEHSALEQYKGPAPT